MGKIILPDICPELLRLLVIPLQEQQAVQRAHRRAGNAVNFLVDAELVEIFPDADLVGTLAAATAEDDAIAKIPHDQLLPDNVGE